MGITPYLGIFHRPRVRPVKENDAAKDVGRVPIPNAICYSFGVLVVVAIPRVTKECCGEGGRVKPFVLLIWAPSAETVILMPACILLVEPSGDVMHGPDYKLNNLVEKPGVPGGADL